MNRYKEKFRELNKKRLQLRLSYDMADRTGKKMIAREIADLDYRIYTEAVEPYMKSKGYSEQDIWDAINMEIAMETK